MIEGLLAARRRSLVTQSAVLGGRRLPDSLFLSCPAAACGFDSHNRDLAMGNRTNPTPPTGVATNAAGRRG